MVVVDGGGGDGGGDGGAKLVTPQRQWHRYSSSTRGHFVPQVFHRIIINARSQYPSKLANISYEYFFDLTCSVFYFSSSMLVLILIVCGGEFYPFRTAVSLRGQLGTNYLKFVWCVPKTGMQL